MSTNLIKLNDPHAQGGSTALDLAADGWVAGTYNAAIISRAFDAINANFETLFNLIGGEYGLLNSELVPFTTVIPVSRTRMPAQCIAGPLTFTVSGIATGYPQTSIDLIADGVHQPDFSAFTINSTDWGTWDNTPGAVNRCVFFPLSSAPNTIMPGPVLNIENHSAEGDESPLTYPPSAPYITGITLHAGTNPMLVIGIGGAGLDPHYVPALSCFSVSGSDGLQVASSYSLKEPPIVTGTAVQVPLQGSCLPGDSVLVNYVAPANAALQDVNGVLMGGLTSIAVTVS